MKKRRFLSVVRIVLTCLGILCALASPAWAGQIPGFYGTIKWDAKTMKSVMDQAQFRSVIQGAQNPVYSNNRLDINQTQEKAILEWNTFNVPPEVSVNFNQAAPSWVALNRIYDANPSNIFGSINAPGKVYLINQNGILFGQGSKVNVNTLIASALNITNSEFLSNLYTKSGNRYQGFIHEDYQNANYKEDTRNSFKLDGNYTYDDGSPIAILNQSSGIYADGGSVFLMAPRVENSGAITVPRGQIGLVAGTEVQLVQSATDDTVRSGYYVINKTDFANPLHPSFGLATNQAGGALLADGGIVGMYGNNVEHLGTIRSITAYVNKKGMVELRAANSVATGAGSVIQLPVDTSIDPATGKLVTVDDTFDIQPVVDIRGLHKWDGSGLSIIDPIPVKRIEHRGLIQAPAGKVTMAAADRIYLETGSRIDVSGVDAELPASVLSSKLNSLELRDAYGQKGGVLQGETITTSVTVGSAIGDLSQLILTQARTALERSIGGARRTIVDQKTGTITYSKDDNTQTGAISLTAAGDLIVRQGAVLDVSGGSVHVTGGFYDATKLLFGARIYDIASAPLNLKYDRIMDQYTRTYERFGVKETYAGIYYGGSSPLMSRMGSYTVGGDTGALKLSAARIILDGQIAGGVTKGAYQNASTMKGSYSVDSDYDLALALSVRRGLETPRAGTLTIDTSGITTTQTGEQFARESSIEVRSDTSPAEIPADPVWKGGTTLLSARMLNAAGLGTLTLAANLAVSIKEDAEIRLQPGGSFSATARRIDHQGKVAVPGGRINMVIGQNATSKKDAEGNNNPFYIAMTEREEIILGPLSKLDASGERIDNSLAGKAGNITLRSGQTTGGMIRIMDQTDEGSGVSIRNGAVVDVSGGYTIDQKGRITGGSAGLLDIQGSKILLDGDIRGHALGDASGKLLGASITLRSTNIRVAPVAYESPDVFVLAGNRLDDTGFTQIALYSFNDVIIEPDMTLRTSLVRLANPIPGRQSETTAATQISPDIGVPVPGRSDLIRLNDSAAFMAGPASFTALAGRVFEPIQVGGESRFTGHLKAVTADMQAKVLVSERAAVRTAPAVSGVTRVANEVAIGPSPVKTGITLTGPNVEIRGTLESLGGDITAQSTSTIINFGNLNVSTDAKIIAHGYNLPDPGSTMKNYPANYLPVAGGKVTLSAFSNLALERRNDGGASIDISGSDAFENKLRTADGTIFTFREAGDPGSISLTFGGNLTWAGIVKTKNATTGVEGTKGGTLTVTRSQSTLNVAGEDIQRYRNSGFDDITLKGAFSIRFNGMVQEEIGRKLTLDTPVISGSGQDVNLSSPWIILTNSMTNTSPLGGVNGGTLTLTSNKGWIDVIGTVGVDGFQNVALHAGRDIRLGEAAIKIGSNIYSVGKLEAKGNLTLEADRIYPGSFYSYVKDDATDYSGRYSNFTITAGNKMMVQGPASHSNDPIYSAAGSLTITGTEGVELKQGSFLAAPLGTITLNAPGKRIYLAGDTTISTAGADETPVKYGVIDEGNIWKTSITDTQPVSTDRLPVKSITLNADEVVVRNGSRLDVSGSGKLFAYRFQPGATGSVDPLTKANRYVVFKGDSYQFPGDQVYLQGGGGLSEGLYTLLPLNATNARYAFMTEAYIIEVQKGMAIPVSGKASFTKAGYPLTIGYKAVANTPIRGTRPQVYSVRTADEVLKTEGDYFRPTLVSGNAGNIAIAGTTTVIEGTLRGMPVGGYSGGTFTLGGANVIIQPLGASSLPPEFNSGTSFDSTQYLQNTFKGKSTIADVSLSGLGFRKIGLGSESATDSVTVKGGSVLEAAIIALSAKSTAAITIEGNAQLHALTTMDKDSGEGLIELNTQGRLAVNEGSLLHATHDIKLNVKDVSEINGRLQTDRSAITLQSERVFFGEAPPAASGLYVTNDVLNRFSAFENITFMGKDIQFRGAVALSAMESLIFDAAKILDMKTDGASIVTLTAPTVSIKNSAAAMSPTAAPAKAETDRGTFTVNAANSIHVGGGTVFFDGFKTINLTGVNNLTLKGSGSLTTGNATRGYADLNITAARVATGSDSSSAKKYMAPSFTIDAGTAAVRMGASGQSAASSPVPGGLLEILARRIELSTVLCSDGGTIKLTTRGSETDGIFLNSGGQILAPGTDDAPGGRVYLATDYIDGTTARSGRIELAAISLINVDSGGQGDAGLISLSAPVGGVGFSGVLTGKAGIKYQGAASFVAALTGNAGITSLAVTAGNNAIGFTYNGTDYTATVQTGSYSTGSDLASVLQAGLNSAKDSGNNTIQGTPFTASYSAASGKLTIRNSNTYYAVTNFMTTNANTLPPSQMGFSPVSGRGGSLVLDTYQVSNAHMNKTITDWMQLTAMATGGGFTESVDIQARKGNIEIASGKTVRSRNIKLTADDSAANNGKIDIYGTLSAVTERGDGRVELYAMKDVTLQTGGRIDVRGTATDVHGGELIMSSAGGYVNLNPGSAIDVSGGVSGRGGIISLRALRNGNDVKMNLSGMVMGVSSLSAEAFQAYDNVASIDAGKINSWNTDTTSYMSNAGAIKTRLLANLILQGADSSNVHVVPGIEVRNAGDITLSNNWDLTQWRYGNDPGVLTIRAGGALTVNSNLVDHPTTMSSLFASTAKDSWGFNLTAGADLTSAHYLAFVKGTNAAGNPAGSLSIADGRLVYTEGAPVRFASAGDAIIGTGTNPGYMINSSTFMTYSMATYGGPVLGKVGRDLIINVGAIQTGTGNNIIAGGAIQTATGDIIIDAGRNIQFNTTGSSMGAIRTTGQTTATASVQTYTKEVPFNLNDKTIYSPLQQYWSYAGGGDVILNVVGQVRGQSGGSVTEAQLNSAWDVFLTWGDAVQASPGRYKSKLYGRFSANYGEYVAASGMWQSSTDPVTAGIATMGGGDLQVRTGGDFLAQAGSFGEGNLAVYAGGDVRGRFLNKNGRGEIQAGGNFGSYSTAANKRVQIELFDSDFKVAAGGEIQLGAVLNPSLASPKNKYYTKQQSDLSQNIWGTISTYTPDTRIGLKAGSDVTIQGKSLIYSNDQTFAAMERVLPATVNIEAGGNVSLLDSLTLASSPTGHLRVIAKGGDIRGANAAATEEAKSHTIMMSDIAPAYWYGSFKSYDGQNEKPADWIRNRTVNENASDTTVDYYHGYYKDQDKQASARALHYNDDRPVEVKAGGNIKNLNMFFPKKAEVTAEGNIVSIIYEGQNIRPEDVSKIQARGDIDMQYVGTGINLYGPAHLTDPSKDPLVGLVQGGPGAFIVQAGGVMELGVLKDGIQMIGNGHFHRLGTGKGDLVILSGYRFEKTPDDIRTYFATVQKAGDDYAQLMADGKLTDADALLKKTREETIDAFLGKTSGKGDINMTSSQIGTSIGISDISIIAGGDVNLGKTALPAAGKITQKTGITTGGGGDINILSLRDVNVHESRVMTFYGGDITVWSDQGSINAGRGSRAAVSASPPKVNEDGTQVFIPPAIGSGIRAVTYGDNPPDPGNIHLFAPSGIIDAGEAGISGGKIFMWAAEIRNAVNISFSFGSVGVPAATSGATSMGNLSGTGTVMDKGKMTEVMSGAGTTMSQQAGQMLENVMAKWLDVKVIEFVQD